MFGKYQAHLKKNSLVGLTAKVENPEIEKEPETKQREKRITILNEGDYCRSFVLLQLYPNILE